MLLVLDRHDGASNSNAMDAIVENLSAAAAANLENCHKRRRTYGSQCHVFGVGSGKSRAS